MLRQADEQFKVILPCFSFYNGRKPSKGPSARGQFAMNPFTSEKDKLGFIGIGTKGRPIAQRLLGAGFKLTAYDRNRSKAEQLIPIGGTVGARCCGTFLQLQRRVVVPRER
jgi:lactate dehydrogenase-like 2-hydroxyacid dehydrogenase